MKVHILLCFLIAALIAWCSVSVIATNPSPSASARVSPASSRSVTSADKKRSVFNGDTADADGSTDPDDPNDSEVSGDSSTIASLPTKSSIGSEPTTDEEDVSDELMDQLERFWTEGSRIREKKHEGPMRSEDSVEVLRRWHGLTNILVQSTLKRSFSSVASLMMEAGVSSQCQNSMLRLVQGMKKQRTWALKLFDSYGRLSAGFIEGTLTDLGEFTECLNVDIPVNPNDFWRTPRDQIPIDSTGKYCLLELDFPMPDRTSHHLRFDKPIIKVNESDELFGTVWGDISKHMNGMYTVKALRTGICLPSTCRAAEAEALFKRALEPLLMMPVRISPDNECTTRNDRITLTIHQKVGFALYAVILSICVLATLVDLFGCGSESGWRRALLCFAATRNVRKLMHIPQQPSPTDFERVDLRCVHGLRVFSMFWIILGHTYFFGAVYQISYAVKKLIVDVPRYPGKIWYQPLTNAYLVVDSFFFIGGVVLINVAIPMLRKQKGRFNYPLYLLHRALRMIPSLVGFTAFLFFYPLLSSGPIFKKQVNFHMDICERNWYYNLIFLSNILWPREMCAGQIWFTGADFQLYIFAPLVFLCLFKRERIGIALCVFLIAFGGLVSALAAVLTETTATFSLDHLIDQDYLMYQSNIAYFPFYQHITTYVSGILVGYLTLKHNDRQRAIQTGQLSEDPRDPDRERFWKLATNVGWVLAPVCSCFFMFCTFYWNSADNFVELSNAARITLAATQRLGWVAGISFITYQCATGRGGPVRRLLSWPALVPLSRLSFSIYLVHLVPILLRAYSMHYTLPWDDFQFMSMGLMNTVVCIFGALCLHLLFEAPFANMEKVLLQPNRRNNDDDVKKPMSTNLSGKVDDLESHLKPKLTLTQQKSTSTGGSDSLYSSNTSISNVECSQCGSLPGKLPLHHNNNNIWQRWHRHEYTTASANLKADQQTCNFNSV